MADIYIVSEDDDGVCDIKKVEDSTTKEIAGLFEMKTKKSERLGENFEYSLAKLTAAILDDAAEVWREDIRKDDP